jgi:hypothetical protein
MLCNCTTSQLVFTDILDMVTKVSVVVGNLLRRVDAKVSHLEELQKTQGKNTLG